jgi:1,4-dihydroxy-2-naphthoate polyprenyltransferase
MKEKAEVISQNPSLQTWLMAARPKTLTAAFAPVLVATFLARGQGYSVDWLLSIYALISSLCIQIATNLVNDALDFKKGADNHDRVGPKRVTQQGLMTAQQVLFGGGLFFLAAFLFAIPLILKGGIVIAGVVAFSIASGYVYTGGPYPLAYKGLGDIFVILFFGLVSTSAIYYIQTLQMGVAPLLAGLQVGLLCTVLIAVNNLRDCDEDAKVGKMTLAVRFGKTFSRIEIAILALLPFALSFFWIQLGFVFAATLPWMTVLLAVKLVKCIWTTEPGRIYNVLLGFAALLHLAFSMLLCIGFSVV